MMVTGVQCPKCGEKIWSRHRHDFRHCKCGAIFVDGGREYLRYGGQDLKSIKHVKLRVKAEKPKKRLPVDWGKVKTELDLDKIAAGLAAKVRQHTATNTTPIKVRGNLWGGIVGVLGFLRCPACGRSTACELIQRHDDDRGWWLVPKDVPGDWQIASGTSEWTCSENCANIISKMHETGHF